MNDPASIALAISMITALRVFAPAAQALLRRLLGTTVRIGAESLAERRRHAAQQPQSAHGEGRQR